MDIGCVSGDVSRGNVKTTGLSGWFSKDESELHTYLPVKGSQHGGIPHSGCGEGPSLFGSTCTSLLHAPLRSVRRTI